MKNLLVLNHSFRTISSNIIILILVTASIFSCKKDDSGPSGSGNVKDPTCSAKIDTFTFNNSIGLPLDFHDGSITDISVLDNGEVFFIATPLLGGGGWHSLCRFKNGQFEVLYISEHTLQLAAHGNDVYLSLPVSQFWSDPHSLLKWNDESHELAFIDLKGAMFAAKQLAVSPDGYVWGIIGSSLYRVDPGTGTVSPYYTPYENNFDPQNYLLAWEQDNLGFSPDGKIVYITGGLGLYEWDYAQAPEPVWHFYTDLGLGDSGALNRISVSPKTGKVYLYGYDFEPGVEFDPSTKTLTKFDYHADLFFPDEKGNIWAYWGGNFSDAPPSAKDSHQFSLDGCESYQDWVLYNAYAGEQVMAFHNDGKSVWLGLEGAISGNQPALIRIWKP